MPRVHVGVAKNGMAKKCAFKRPQTQACQRVLEILRQRVMQPARSTNFSSPADFWVAMKKRTSLSVLLLVCVAVIGSHIAWVSRDNGTLMVVDGLELDVVGIARNRWTQITRNCSSVVQLGSGDPQVAMAARLIAAYSPPQSASVRLSSVWVAGTWVLAEAEFETLLPAVVLIDASGVAPQIVGNAVWSGYTKPWKAAPFIRAYLAKQAPAAPGALMQCFEPQSLSFQ